MGANIDQVVATATSLTGELLALPERRKAMTDIELDEKLGNLATVADNLAEIAKELQRQAENLKEYA